MKTSKIKATMTITDFAKHADQPSIGLKEFIVKIIATDYHQPIYARLNPKSFRRAQATYKELGGVANVVITGDLDLKGMKMENAGILISPAKSSKTEKDDELAEQPLQSAN